MVASFKRKITGLTTFFLGALVISVFNTWFLFYNFKKVSQQQDLVKHTLTVLQELDLILSSAKDAESGVRGYFLSKNPDQLIPYRDGVIKSWFHFNEGKRLTEDNPLQQDSFGVLAETLKKRLAYLDEALSTYQRQKNENPAEPLNVATGKVAMDLLRDQIEIIKDREKLLLENRATNANQSEIFFYLSLSATGFLSLILIAVAYNLFKRFYEANLKEAQEKTKEAWKNSKLADLSFILAEQKSVEEISTKILNFLAESTQILAGTLYIVDEKWLRRTATYAALTDDELQKKVTPPPLISLERGLLGEALRSQKPVQITEVPANYFPIASSLGSAQPHYLFFLPIYFQRKPIGIIELAGFSPPTDETIEYLKALGESIGVGLNTVQTRERQQALLEKTQQQAEELQAQQEELRVSNEELEEQTRMLESQQQSLEAKNEELETARRDIEMKASDLERASQYKSEFLAKMSHELRTPLNSVLILASLLFENKEKNLNEQQKSFAKSIQDSGNDLLNLINDILDLSKIEARKLTLRPEIFTLGSLFRHLKTTFAPQASEKSLNLLVDYGEYSEDFKLNLDRLRLEQILRNFLSNALKFTEKGSVVLRARSGRHSACIEFCVEDSGIGISREKQDLIFNAFEQGDGSISRRFGGTGLGLTISRELSQLFGGSIRVESEPNQGSQFILELPLKTPDTKVSVSSIKIVTENGVSSVAPEAPPKVSHAAKHIIEKLKEPQKTILIVEDDDDFRASVAETAKGYGFEPIEAADGELALELLKHHAPTAILLDVKLPGLSGMGLLENIKNIPNLRHIPVHIISGLDYHSNALRMGAIGYLEKPATIAEVRNVLSRIESMISQKMKRLLIIEDDQRQQEALKQLVSGPDIEVHIATSGQTAFDLLQNQTFDCIILDLTLPDVSGLELLDRWNALEIPLPPIVIYTGKDLLPGEEEKLRHYSDSIILKGAKSPERLLDEVNLFLHRMESLLPEEKKHMLTEMRTKERLFEGKTALLVDDDLRNVFALTSALEGKGFCVRVARNGLEALDVLKDFSDVDIVLMDLMMPKMDGLECMAHIRKMPFYQNIPIIALTAKAMKGDYEKCIEAGANDYLPKPIHLTNLLSVMKVWLNPPGLFL